MKIITISKFKEFFQLLQEVLGKKELSDQHRAALDTYILQVDYESTLAFDTDLIITGGATSSIIGIGQIGAMIISG